MARAMSVPAFLLAAALLVGGCGGDFTAQDAPEEADVDEIPPGPGLLSGEDGVFELEIPR